MGQMIGALKVLVFSGCKGNSMVGTPKGGLINDPTPVLSGGKGRGQLVLCRGLALGGPSVCL